VPRHEYAVALKRAGELLELAAARRWTDDAAGALAAARPLLEQAVRSETEDPWRPELILSRVELRTGHPERALEILTVALRRSSRDFGGDRRNEARALRAVAALRAGSDQARALTDAALKGDAEEAAANLGYLTHPDTVLVDAVLLAREGRFAEARARIDGCAKDVGAGRVASPLVFTAEDARREVDALEARGGERR
ncbi:MAG: hypothetical protein ACAI25_17140, partial [Planctomycetota bacterium]